MCSDGISWTPNDLVSEHSWTDDLVFFFVQESRLNGFRSPMEFFDFNRLSRPADFNTAVSVSLAHIAFVPIGKGSRY